MCTVVQTSFSDVRWESIMGFFAYVLLSILWIVTNLFFAHRKPGSWHQRKICFWCCIATSCGLPILPYSLVDYQTSVYRESFLHRSRQVLLSETAGDLSVSNLWVLNITPAKATVLVTDQCGDGIVIYFRKSGGQWSPVKRQEGGFSEVVWSGECEGNADDNVFPPFPEGGW